MSDRRCAVEIWTAFVKFGRHSRRHRVREQSPWEMVDTSAIITSTYSRNFVSQRIQIRRLFCSGRPTFLRIAGAAYFQTRVQIRGQRLSWSRPPSPVQYISVLTFTEMGAAAIDRSRRQRKRSGQGETIVARTTFRVDRQLFLFRGFSHGSKAVPIT